MGKGWRKGGVCSVGVFFVSSSMCRKGVDQKRGCARLASSTSSLPRPEGSLSLFRSCSPSPKCGNTEGARRVTNSRNHGDKIHASGVQSTVLASDFMASDGNLPKELQKDRSGSSYPRSISLFSPITGYRHLVCTLL